MFEPVQELFSKRVDAGPPGVEPEMGLLVRGAPLMIQVFEPRTIG